MDYLKKERGEYWRNRYKNMSIESKQILKENQMKYRDFDFFIA